MSIQTDHAKTAIAAVLDKWTRAFIAQDVEGLRGLWDDTYEGLVYQAEEFAAPLVTVRQTFVMRNVNGSWKMVHYHESLQTMATPEDLHLDEPDPA